MTSNFTGERPKVPRPTRTVYRSLGNRTTEAAPSSAASPLSTKSPNAVHDGRSIGIFGLSRYGRLKYGAKRLIYGTDTYDNAVYHPEQGSGGGKQDIVRRVTTTYTVVGNDHVLFCDTDDGAWTLTLRAGVSGKNLKIINCGSSGNDLTVDGSGTETVYGELTQTVSDGEVIDIHYHPVEGWW